MAHNTPSFFQSDPAKDQRIRNLDLEQDNSCSRAKLLSLREIASWQLPHIVPAALEVIAALPALQRGAVWKPHQVERLWDSLVRGFPIGAFLLAPFDKDRGIKKFKYQSADTSPRFHLLDGQQRANAIALGFLNPWTTNGILPATLWVDLAPPPDTSDLQFLFRVLTKTHPWGYRREDPARRISNGQMHDQMNAFRRVSPQELKGKRPSQITLDHAWPHNAEAPIPLPLLLEAIQEFPEDPIASLRSKLEQLPIWRAALREGLPWTSNVTAALNGTDERLNGQLRTLCAGTVICLGETIPAVAIRGNIAHERQPATVAGKDAWETLFIRVNTAGTELKGEELIYSLLKSAYPAAQELVEQLRFGMIPAPRLVLLTTRLVLASLPDHSVQPPSSPNVSDFRKLLKATDFKELMQDFIQNPCEGQRIFKTAKILLEDETHGLPSVLSCGIARSQPDVMLLLLRWIQRMYKSNLDPSVMPVEDRQRLIGMVTAFSWFSKDPGQCVRLLWEALQSCPDRDLTRFFCRANFQLTLQLGPNDSLRMLPLVSPDVLAHFIETRVTSSSEFLDLEGAYWTGGWNWWERMQPNALADAGKVTVWYRNSFARLWEGRAREDGSRFDFTSTSSGAWAALIERLGDWRRRNDLLLYAQRGWIRGCFPDYDPSLPEQMEDINCPWDFDHIHAQSYVGRWYIPQIIKDWHGTMGNFRAWPFDINRSDHDSAPREKFGSINPMEDERYGLSDPQDKRYKSFIGDEAEWLLWQESAPPAPVDGRYLSKETKYRQTLVKAMISRFVRIYAEWYNSLRLGDLMPAATVDNVPHGGQ